MATGVKWSCETLLSVAIKEGPFPSIIGLRACLYVFALTSLVAAQLVCTLLPETAGRPLEEVCSQPVGKAWLWGADAPAACDQCGPCDHTAPAETQVTAQDAEAALEPSCESSAAASVLVNAARSSFSTPLLTPRNVVLLDGPGGVRGNISKCCSRLRGCFAREQYTRLLCKLFVGACEHLYPKSLDRSVRLMPNEESQSTLALLCAVDVWVTTLWIFLACIVIVRLNGDSYKLVPHNGTENEGPIPWSYELGPSTFQCLLFGVLLGYLAIVRLALLTSFFMRDWSLVLFLYKLFEWGLLLISIFIYMCTWLAHGGLFTPSTQSFSAIRYFNCVRYSRQLPRIHASCTARLSCRCSDATVPPVVDVELRVLFKSAFVFYMAMVTWQLHQLWRLPRIKEHYRRLPTRKEIVETDPGILQFGSFIFSRDDLIGHGATVCDCHAMCFEFMGLRAVVVGVSEL